MIPHIQQNLLKWSYSHRRDFYWRKPGIPPFHVLVAEMLLRKTRASAVEKTIATLLGEYPTPGKMAQAGVEKVGKHIRPLGLHRIRGQALVAVSKEIVEQHGGKVHPDYSALLSLPHVGRYTANAVLCTAFGERCPMVDVNVVRVFNRVFGLPIPTEIHKAEDLWSFAEKLLPNDARSFNWALMDLGALICLHRSPKCPACPLKDLCKYANPSNAEESIILD